MRSRARGETSRRPGGGAPRVASRRPSGGDARRPSRMGSSLLGALSGIQARLRIGKPGDKYEQEAESVADRVAGSGSALPLAISRMGSPSQPGAAGSGIRRQAEEEEAAQPAPVQRQEEEEEAAQPALVQRQEEEEEAAQPALVQRQEEEEEEAAQPALVQRQEEEEEEAAQPALVQRQEEEEEEAAQPALVQRQEEVEEEEEEAQPALVQRQEEEEEAAQPAAKAPPGQAPAQVAAAVGSPGSGAPLPPSTRERLESRMGADLSSVRIHEGGQAQAAARSIHARAFTWKNHVWLGRSESTTDVRLMAHEATHVVQQGAAVQRIPTALAVSRAPVGVQGGFWSSLRDAASAVGSAVSSAASAVVNTVRDLGAAALRRLLGLVRPFAHRIPGYPLLTVILGRDPITDEPVERNATNLVRGFMSLIPGGTEIFKRIQESGALQKTFSWISDQVTKLDLSWSKIKSLFSRAWEALSISDVASPSKAFAKIKHIFGPPVARLVRFAKAVGTKVKEFVFEAALRLAGPMAAKVMGFIRRAGGALSAVFNDPIGFLKNLLAAVAKGFKQFSANILSHLKKGLLGWLFGAMEGAGIQLPEKFDLKGIISLVLQVLGLTYQRIRAKLVKRFGEERVARIEQGIEFVKILVTEGLAGVWRKILEYFDNLQETVMSAIRDWVITKIVVSAVTKLASMFNPVGAIIQAVITIYNVVAFFVERFKQILALANAVFESIANIAAGKIGAAANYVEKTMARTIPVILSFLARLLGLGGISAKIKKIIGAIQERVDRVIDKVLDFIIKKAKALFGMAKRGAAKAKDAVVSVFEWWKTRKSFKVGKESHSVFFQGKARDAKLKVASTPTDFEAYLKGLEDKGADKAKTKKAREKHKEIEVTKKGDGGDRPKYDRALGEKIQKLLDQLLVLLVDAAPGTSEARPPTKVDFVTATVGGGTVGAKMTAWPLTMNSGGFVGSQPHETNPFWEKVRRREGAYVRGHLLNHQVHGPGENRNLTPITRTANALMETKMERKAKTAVLEKNEVVRYEVEVDYDGHGARKYIPEESLMASKVRMTLQHKKLKEGGDPLTLGDWSDGKTETAGIENDLPPDRPVDETRETVVLSSATAAQLVTIPGIGAELAANIVKTRNERPTKAFSRWHQLMEVDGIGEKTATKLADDKYVTLYSG